VHPIPQSVADFIGAARVCRIATVRSNGEPHVIPVCPVFDGDRTVFVDLGERSLTALALAGERRVTVLIDEYDEDWTRLRKVLLRCTAEPVTGAEQEAAWVRIRAKFPQYTSVDWKPRLTMALCIDSWMQEGIVREHGDSAT
jgi:nitroimidazol reductase NimA-like FMN-containing flavoprotein (pyridoxamine 5'-phosphate oxidase superfamily)